MKSPSSCGLGILLILLISLTGRGETVVIPWQPVPDARQPAIPLTAVLSLPDGKGPFPDARHPAIITTHSPPQATGQATL
jgi:hypothetical protein